MAFPFQSAFALLQAETCGTLINYIFCICEFFLTSFLHSLIAHCIGRLMVVATLSAYFFLFFPPHICKQLFAFSHRPLYWQIKVVATLSAYFFLFFPPHM